VSSSSQILVQVDGILMCQLLCVWKLYVTVLVRDADERAALEAALNTFDVRFELSLNGMLGVGERFNHVIELRPSRATGEAHVESRVIVSALAAHGAITVCHSRARELTAVLTPPMTRKSARVGFAFEHTWASAALLRGKLVAALVDLQLRFATRRARADATAIVDATVGDVSVNNNDTDDIQVSW
jgi:hypothetical protein